MGTHQNIATLEWVNKSGLFTLDFQHCHQHRPTEHHQRRFSRRTLEVADVLTTFRDDFQQPAPLEIQHCSCCSRRDTMTAMRGPRLQVGSAAWVGEERASALEIVQSEVEEFSYSAHNEIEWLNEHMAAILNENEVYVAPFPIHHPPLRWPMLIPLSSNITEVFKTPGKLRGKTPHTARKVNAIESRVVGLLQRPFSL